MAAKTTILKENGTDDILYPVTKVGAVYTDDGVTPIGDWVDDINDAVSRAMTTTSDSQTNTVTFTSDDSTTPTQWTNVDTLASGETHSNILGKISTMFKNIRYLWNLLGSNTLGTTATTITGAIAEHEEDISELNGNLSKKFIETTGSSTELTNTYAVIPCTYVAANTNEEYFGTGSNGIVCKKSGRVLVELWARANSLTAGDVVVIQFCVYRNGSLLWDSYGAAGSGKAMLSVSLIRQVRDVEAGDIICLRAQNQSGARGNLYPFRMNVEYL